MKQSGAIDPLPLRDLLAEAAGSGSAAGRAVAALMLADLAAVPFETAASLAARAGVSEATVGRFCRSLGFASLKNLKARLRNDVGGQPWLIGDRLRELRARHAAGEDQLARALELEMAALVAVHEIAHGPDFARVVARLATARAVYVAGFQTERGMAAILVHQLQYLRPDVHLLDLAAGNFAELLADAADGAALVMFEARRYSRLAPALAREAKAAGIPVTLVTDSYCDWGHGVVDEVFAVPTAVNLFWESAAQMASLANLLVNGVFLALGSPAEARMARVADLYDRFTGQVGGRRAPA